MRKSVMGVAVVLLLVGTATAGSNDKLWQVTEKSKSQKLTPSGTSINVQNDGNTSVVVRLLDKDGNFVREETVPANSDRDIRWNNSDYTVWVVHNGGDTNGCFEDIT